MALSGTRALQLEVAGKCVYFCCDAMLKMARKFEMEASAYQTKVLLDDVFNKMQEHSKSYRQPKVLTGKEQRYRIRKLDPINCFAHAVCASLRMESGVVVFNADMTRRMYYEITKFLKEELDGLSEEDYGTMAVAPYVADYVYNLLNTAWNLCSDAGADRAIMQRIENIHAVVVKLLEAHYGFSDPESYFGVFLINMLDEHVRGKF